MKSRKGAVKWPHEICDKICNKVRCHFTLIYNVQIDTILRIFYLATLSLFSGNLTAQNISVHDGSEGSVVKQTNLSIYGGSSYAVKAEYTGTYQNNQVTNFKKISVEIEGNTESGKDKERTHYSLSCFKQTMLYDTNSESIKVCDKPNIQGDVTFFENGKKSSGKLVGIIFPAGGYLHESYLIGVETGSLASVPTKDLKDFLDSSYYQMNITGNPSNVNLYKIDKNLLPLNRGFSAIHLASNSNNTDLVKLHLRRKNKKVENTSYGTTPLHLARSENIVTLLLDAGYGLETKDQFGKTPLFKAVDRGDKIVCRELIKNGADIESKDFLGRTPLMYAVLNGNMDVVVTLIDSKADLNARDNRGRTPLHMGSYKGDKSIVKVLVDSGAEIESKDSDGYTPFMFAVRVGKLESITILEQMGSNILLKTNSGLDSIAIASKHGYKNVSNFLNKKIKDVQNNLKYLGYSVGIPDGIWGNMSQSALTKFQKDFSLPLTETLDIATKIELFRQGADVSK